MSGYHRRGFTRVVFDRAHAMVCRTSPWSPSSYSEMTSIINAADDRASTKKPATEVTTIRLPGPIESLNLRHLQKLVKLDTKHDSALLRLQIDKDFAGPKPLRHQKYLNRLFENRLHPDYVIDNDVESLRTEQFPRALSQIYYSETPVEKDSLDYKLKRQILKTTEDKRLYKGSELIPKTTLKVKVPFQLDNGKEHELVIPSLETYPSIKALGISKNHPEFADLIDKKITLPQVGEVTFIAVDAEDAENFIIGLIPSFVLKHRKYFDVEHPIQKIGQFQIADFPGKTLSADEVSIHLAKQLNISPPIFTITPYIVEKFHNIEGMPLTTIKDRKEYVHREPDEVIEQKDDYLDEAGLLSRLNIFTYGHSAENFGRLQSRYNAPSVKRNSLPLVLETVTMRRFENMAFSGFPLSTGSKAATPIHFKKASSDTIRALLLSQSRISDEDIRTEYSICQTWSSCLQHHLFEYYVDHSKSRQDADNTAVSPDDTPKFQYSDSIRELLDANESNTRPWDFCVAADLYKIQDKDSFNEFIHNFAQYLATVNSETVKSSNRREFVFQLCSNIIYRMLYGESSYYYPSLSRFFISRFKYQTPPPSTAKITESSKVNPHRKHITYLYENIPNDEGLRNLFRVIKAVTGYKRFTDFYKVSVCLVARDPNLAPYYTMIKSAANYDLKIKEDLAENFFRDKCVHRHSELEKVSGTELILYRDLHTGAEVPTVIEKKLRELGFKSNAKIPVVELKQDLLYRLLEDITRISKLNKYSQKDQASHYKFAVHFVSSLPNEFFQHPSLDQMESEEFTPLEDRKDIKAAYLQLMERIRAAKVKAELTAIITDFLIRNNQKDI